MKNNCPHCKEEYKLPEGQHQKDFKCPSCQKFVNTDPAIYDDATWAEVGCSCEHCRSKQHR